MSNKASPANVGGTLAGGIQDVAAILPLIGTEQCEKHVGSALTGGYLYAAAAPLSIFGSLGIVKAGIAILVSSISFSIPNLSTSLSNFKPSITYSGQLKWLGGRMLKDAGFELTGVVAPLIGMDGHRFKAETRLIEMLEEKHIDDPEKITIDWKSRQWNVMLVVSTLFGAALSLTPYIALLLGPASWRPTSIHLPWLFPTLRIVGSCTAAVACQLIIQFRVISLMKNRILFMTIDQRLNGTFKEEFDTWLKDPQLKWDASFPAEQCIWSLDRYISSFGPLIRPVEGLEETKDRGSAIQQAIARTSERTSKDPIKDRNSTVAHTCDKQAFVSLSEGISGDSDYISIPMAIPQDDILLSTAGQASFGVPPAPPETQSFNISDLHHLQQKHFPSSTRNSIFFVLTWIMLGLSLPMTVAGYIGCFTLVGAIPPLGNGPLIWVGLEAALSVLRIFIWASNPSFDEETEISLGLKLSKHQPMVTADDYNPHGTDLNNAKRKPFILVPGREFLERITPFTGPLDQFQKTDNITLYFTLTGDEWESFCRASKSDAQYYDVQPERMCLFMTVFDFNMQVGVMFVSSKMSFNYFDVTFKYNTVSRQLEADIQSEKRLSHPWRTEDGTLFDSLEIYYRYIVGAFNQRDTDTLKATLSWKWDLSQRSSASNNLNQGNNQNLSLPLLTLENQSYLDQGYEQHLKTELIATWSKWIVTDMANIRSHTRNSCYEALKDASGDRGKRELTELDVQLVWGWAYRELVLLILSKELEDILSMKMGVCASEISCVRQDDLSVRTWIRLEFESGRRKRMERERMEAKKRMERAMKEASEQADREGRAWQEMFSFPPQWAKAIKFIDEHWSSESESESAGINAGNRRTELREAQDGLREMAREGLGFGRHEWDSFVEEFNKRVSHEHWRPQREIEERMMKATVERVRNLSANNTCTTTRTRRNNLDAAYTYPETDDQATAKFAALLFSSSRGQACSAMVYDAFACGVDAVCDVVAKSTTRSVVRVNPKILGSIPPNDHLLFLSCYPEPSPSAEEDLEPAFVQRNRERWWAQAQAQQTSSSTFYFTPRGVQQGDSCYSTSESTKAIARILIFLTAPSPVRVRLLHRGVNAINVSIRENAKGLGRLSSSDVILQTFQLHEFRPFVLPQGRHELELVPQIRADAVGCYYLRDVLIELRVLDGEKPD